MTKAEALLSHIEGVKVNSAIAWKIYEETTLLTPKPSKATLRAFSIRRISCLSPW